MKLVLFDDYRPGVLKNGGIVDISPVVSVGHDGVASIAYADIHRSNLLGD
jgi:hypothetical protein